MIQQPNPTVYIKNIDWKIKRSLLRRALYALFTRFGKVLEIITLRRDGLRGQAWIIYDTIHSATMAIQSLQGFTFFGKDLVLEYARSQSDRIAKRDGTFQPKAKRMKLGEREATDHGNAHPEMEQHPTEDNSAVPTNNNPDTTATSGNPNDPATIQAPPSRFLMANNLPVECNEMALTLLFQQYAGFQEVRVPRTGLAFIQFQEEIHATLAKNSLNGYKLTPTMSLQLVYGKE